MEKSIITLMALFIIMMFISYIIITAYNLTASIRKGYMDTDESYYKNRARRKMYCLQGDLQDSTGSRTYFVIQMLIYMLVMRVKQSLTHAARELL